MKVKALVPIKIIEAAPNKNMSVICAFSLYNTFKSIKAINVYKK